MSSAGSSILYSIAIAVVSGVLVAWFRGVFDSLLPSSLQSAAVIKDLISWVRWRHHRRIDRFSVLIATLSGDESDRRNTLAIERAFRGDERIERARRNRTFWLKDASVHSEITALRAAKRTLNRWDADLLIWGEQSEKALSLWFTSRNPESNFEQTRFTLDTNLLGTDFDKTSTAGLVAVALSAIKPLEDRPTEYLNDVLITLAARLQRLLDASSRLTAKQVSDLQLALGITRTAIGENTADREALSNAIELLESAVTSFEKATEPLLWARAQYFLGRAFLALSDEIGHTNLQKATEAFTAALEEYTRERSPIEWARVKNSLGITLSDIGVNQKDEAYLRRSLRAYKDALEIRTKKEMPE